MTALDTNILVALTFSDHPLHARATSIVVDEVRMGRQLVIVSLLVEENLHVVTDERRFRPPLLMLEALDWINEFLAKPHVVLKTPSLESVQLTLAWMKQFKIGRKRILDTHLAATLHAAGVPRLVTSNPADFRLFESLNIIAVGEHV